MLRCAALCFLVRAEVEEKAWMVKRSPRSEASEMKRRQVGTHRLDGGQGLRQQASWIANSKEYQQQLSAPPGHPQHLSLARPLAASPLP